MAQLGNKAPDIIMRDSAVVALKTHDSIIVNNVMFHLVLQLQKQLFYDRSSFRQLYIVLCIYLNRIPVKKVSGNLGSVDFISSDLIASDLRP